MTDDERKEAIEDLGKQVSTLLINAMVLMDIPNYMNVNTESELLGDLFTVEIKLKRKPIL